MSSSNISHSPVLIKVVLEQIEKDIQSNNTKPLIDLIKSIDPESLHLYLPRRLQIKYINKEKQDDNNN